MKTPITLIIVFLFLTHLYSCEPTAADLARIQRHDDSIKQIVERKYAAQSELKDAINNLDGLRRRLESAKASLKSENDRMIKLRDSLTGKTSKEATWELKKQAVVIQSIKDNIATLDHKISEARERTTSIKMEVQRYQ